MTELLSQDQKQLDEKLEIYIPNGPRLGTNVIESQTGVSPKHLGINYCMKT